MHQLVKRFGCSRSNLRLQPPEFNRFGLAPLPNDGARKLPVNFLKELKVSAHCGLLIGLPGIICGIHGTTGTVASTSIWRSCFSWRGVIKTMLAWSSLNHLPTLSYDASPITNR